MAYKTYITEALVCGSYDRHTSDRLYILFTRDAGMVYAAARSVREERSKQRYALQDFSHVRATLIHGKSGWRIAGVEPICNYYTRCESREARACIRNGVLLLRRCVHGEVPHTEIFDDMVVAYERVHTCDTGALSLMVSLRMLFALGYVAWHEDLDRMLAARDPVESVRGVTDTEKARCSVAVEHALEQSQL